jgi:hypothetical protein
MPDVSQHIIQKQIIEIEFRNFDDPIGLQNRIAEVFCEKLQPGIENLFDEIAGKNSFACIEKLEIDSGLISKENWEQELVDNTLRQLKTELSVIGKKEISQSNDISEHAFQSFIFFLENGYFPWNNRFDSLEELERALVFNSNLIEELKALIRKYDQVSKRIDYQFSEHFRLEIIDLFSADRKNILRTLITIREDMKQLQIDGNTIDSAIIKALAFNENEIVVQQFLKYLFNNVQEETKPVLGEIIKSLDKAIKEDVNEEIKIEALSESVYIRNSGMIILHPFLPELFGQLGLTKEQKWLNKQLQHKASEILSFLATGLDDFPEFDLPLNKILCGIALDDVIIPQYELSKEIKSECENLLNQTIKHWNVLKNTSNEALRETFLMRNGKLSRVDNGWLLQVEQKPVDILLSHLPWGIGLIKLPWMNEMLHVEWT